MSRMEMRKVDTRDESTSEYAHWYSDMTAAFSLALNDASLAACSGAPEPLARSSDHRTVLRSPRCFRRRPVASAAADITTAPARRFLFRGTTTH